MVLLGRRDRKATTSVLLVSSVLILFAVLIYPLYACYGVIFFVIAIAASTEKEDQKLVEKRLRLFLSLNLIVAFFGGYFIQSYLEFMD